VVWITIHGELLPDSSDGKDHEWAQQVGVSRETYKPVMLRETRDGQPGPLGTRQRVLELETLPAGEGDFTASESHSLEGMAFKEGRSPIALEQAGETLGRRPLWLGREHEGLPLAEVFRHTTGVGRHEEIRLTGEIARAAEECSKLRGEAAGRCFRALGYRGSLAVREDGVFAYGPTAWEKEQVGVVLFYGTLGDEPSTYRKELVPRYDAPHVTITETTHRSVVRGVGRYVPPEGAVFIGAGGRTGLLSVDGLYVSIQAPSDELILSAARALEPMPR
jgi:hypothetical protein